MDTSWSLLLELGESEFDGESFNGPSLMKTLEALDPDMAAYSATHEGYSAWEVAHHVAYYKHFIARSIDPATPEYPLPKGPFGFAQPPDVGPAAWKATLDGLRTVHRAAMTAAKGFPASRLGELVPKWEIPFGRAIAWLCTHDTYHAAQLRSMGVPGLKEPKEG
jgi:hypothetical protein